MLGPLPRLHTVLLVCAVVGVAAGAWLGVLETVPVVVTTGIALGAAFAALASYLLLHDFHHRHAQVVRTRRHR